ncbi:hypothetical protein [Janthinobacterium sp. LB2P70]|uniref:hypothetical protein n=1 Tax=Janthinobacterium sp. LB2P70 TaxID=3424197 RepID=UPI003F21C518
MGFAEKYIASIGSSNLMDDAQHHQTDPLAAAALAGDIGALLCRVKYADGTLNRMFEGNQQNLAQLLRIWTVEVIRRGQMRRWVPANTAWDAAAAQALYRRVAEKSLAHWLDSTCKGCSGTGVKALLGNGICTSCKGSGAAAIHGTAGLELERVKDMVSELSAIADSHSGRASGLLRGGDR